jgi:acetoin utilization deacetylase AcuC-like enzyme
MGDEHREEHRSNMSLLLATPAADHHDPGARHPERAARLVTAIAALGDIPDPDAVVRLSPRSASTAELSLVHDPGYLEALADLCAAGGGSLDPDTWVSSGSWETALMTAGAGLAAVDALRADDGDAALVLGRPPGHHATRDVGMGFCLVNNIAVAAASLVAAGERVAIIDWDVHHGNGTQDIFWFEPSVLYVSIHQSPLYPGTGRANERGGGEAWGTTINLPLPPGATGDVYLALFDEVVIPSVERFGATWVLISAGFDAHRDDPLANMGLTAGDFADLTTRVTSLAGRPGRLALFLEGGYDLPALRLSVAACAAQLVGTPYRPESASSGGSGHALVGSYRTQWLDDRQGPP